jgi:hypothetical protein
MAGAPEPSVGTLHFDLSHTPQDAEHTLHVAGVDYTLSAHTPETRALHAGQNTVLAAVPDDQQHRISHFVENVQLPGHVAMMFVQHPSKDPNSPLPALSLTALHIPAPARAALRAAKAAAPVMLKAGAPKLAASAPSLAGRKLMLMAAAPPPAVDPDVSDDHAHSFKTPLDTAIALTAAHPELMHFDPATAAHIHDNHLVSAPGIEDLALSLSQQGAADTDGGWATISTGTDENGKVVTNDAGQPIYQYALSDDTKAAMASPIKGALRSTKNDMALKDKVWGQNYGVTSLDHSAAAAGASAATASARPTAAPAASPPTAPGPVALQTRVNETPAPTPPSDGDAKWTPKNWTSIYGLNLGTVQALGTGDYSLDVTNNALRHMSTSVEFLDDMGNTLPDTRQSLQLLLPGNFLMGIPIPTASNTLTFTIPDSASGARLLFGTLGTGKFDASVAGMGMFSTALFEMAVPTFMLAAGIWVQRQGGFIALLKDREFMAVIGVLALQFATPKLVQSVEDDPVGALVTIGNKLTGLLLSTAMRALRNWIVENMVGEEAEKYVPFVGFVFAALGVAGTLADLAETTAAVIETPSTSSVEIARTMTLKVNVQCDPQHAMWPSTAHQYRLMVQYQGGTFMHLDGEMFEFTNGVTSANPIVKSFSNVPAGGYLKVYAVIYSRNWWICGYASSADWVRATPGSGASLTVDLIIKERLVPLTADTRYSHNEVLTYTAAKGHQWSGGTDTTPLAAPTETATALDDSPTGNHLGELIEITINDHAHTLGYCWRASGQGLPFVGSKDVSNSQMYAFQNISYLGSPESGLKSTNAGYTGRPHILYDQFGPLAEGATGDGNNFYLDVVGEVYHLRRIAFDAKPIDLNPKKPPLSWGKFTQPHLDAIVVHPAGWVAAVSFKNSKLEVLQIPAAGTADADAPAAQLRSGEGSVEGLINGPVALAVTPDGNLLVLESLNNRIQAFDMVGNPVQAFGAAGAKSSHMSLHARDGTSTYLDLGTESKGYIYVLSHIGDGSSQTQYNLDIYEPTGAYLCTTNGLNAAKLVVSLWRDVYALNYQVLLGPSNRTEPSVSQWIPSTPAGVNPNG